MLSSVGEERSPLFIIHYPLFISSLRSKRSSFIIHYSFGAGAPKGCCTQHDTAQCGCKSGKKFITKFWEVQKPFSKKVSGGCRATPCAPPKNKHALDRKRPFSLSRTNGLTIRGATLLHRFAMHLYGIPTYPRRLTCAIRCEILGQSSCSGLCSAPSAVHLPIGVAPVSQRHGLSVPS